MGGRGYDFSKHIQYITGENFLSPPPSLPPQNQYLKHIYPCLASINLKTRLLFSWNIIKKNFKLAKTKYLMESKKNFL